MKMPPPSCNQELLPTCNTDATRKVMDPPAASESTMDRMLSPSHTSPVERMIATKRKSWMHACNHMLPPTSRESTSSIESMNTTRMAIDPPAASESATSIESTNTTRVVMDPATAKESMTLIESMDTTRVAMDPPTANESTTSIELMMMPSSLPTSPLAKTSTMSQPSLMRACNQSLPILDTVVATSESTTYIESMKLPPAPTFPVSSAEMMSMTHTSLLHSCNQSLRILDSMSVSTTTFPPPTASESTSVSLFGTVLPILDTITASKSSAQPTASQLITSKELLKVPLPSSACSSEITTIPTTSSAHLCNKALPILDTNTASESSASFTGFDTAKTFHGYNHCGEGADATAVVGFDNMTESKLSGFTFMPPNESTALHLMRLSPSEEMLMQTSVHDRYLDAQASSLQVDTAQQREELGEIEGCSESRSSLGSVTSFDSISVCLSDIIAEATLTQANLLREANDMELKLDDKELVAEIDMAATARADVLFEKTVSVVLHQTETSTISSLPSPSTVTRTCKTAKLVSKRSIVGKWRWSSSPRVASRKATGRMSTQSSLIKKRSINQESEVVIPNTSDQPEVMTRPDVLELSEDRLHSFKKMHMDGKLARCVAGGGHTS